ncbi:DUF1294 domain-containing protein [Herpetosiphon sp. NSE202]|uniref:DUF1294 domain-containing protein n=1 Tax=Herpetosiphon sp. NSE202 TaxID=3351349 RepID=UPI00362B9EA4
MAQRGRIPAGLGHFLVAFGLGAAFNLGYSYGLIGLIVISFITLIAFILDKQQSKDRRNRRIAESTLLLFVAFGGTLGAVIGIWFFRHKSQKTSFLQGFWLIVGCQVVGLLAVGLVRNFLVN